MSEKRFKGYAEKTGQHYELVIIDEIREEYILTDDFFKSKDVIFEIVDLLNVMNDTLVTQARENHKLSNNLNEQQATIQSLKERLYDFEKRKIIEESAIDEDVIPKVKLLRAELFGEKYE